MPFVAAPPEQRFWPRVDKTDSCWVWRGQLNNQGYGQFSIKKRHKLAHRLSYEWTIGPIPEGLELDHLCRNTKCVNPAHLEPVTHAENMRRGNQGKYLRDRTHCIHGHAFDEANTYILPRNGSRVCRKCRVRRVCAAQKKHGRSRDKR